MNIISDVCVCVFVYCDSIALCYDGARLHNILRASYSVMFSAEIHTLDSMMDKTNSTRLAAHRRCSIISFIFSSLRGVCNNNNNNKGVRSIYS